MPSVCDNWERLVVAALRKQQLWELCHEQSRSTSSVSSDSSFSFQFNSWPDDALPSISNGNSDLVASDFDLFGSTTASCSTKYQLKNSWKSSSPGFRKRNLNIQVPRSSNLSLPSNSNVSSSLQPRVRGRYSESPCNWPDYAYQQGHPLPLPPPRSMKYSPSSSGNSAATSPTLPSSPKRIKNLASPGSWKKGTLLGRGEYGNVYAGFNSETGEMCAINEISFSGNEEESKRTSEKLQRDIAVLSNLKHPNIVKYHGSKMANGELYVYLEYVSGGSIYQILEQYGSLGESALRSYTQQILTGLVYLHGKNTAHRNVKGSTIVVEPNGCVKLSNFGMAKYRNAIADQFNSSLCTSSPYWFAPEVINSSSVCLRASDIWSLGCTVLEMATCKPPWSQYSEAVAMFKIVNCKEFPLVPDYLSDEGKDFVMQCLRRNPLHRPTASQLLEHPFVRNGKPQEKLVKSSDSLESEIFAIHSSVVSRSTPNSRDISIQRNIFSPRSPGTPRQHPISPPYPISGHHHLHYQHLLLRLVKSWELATLQCRPTIRRTFVR